MTEVKDGGQAFPCAGLSEGMSLRDWFAGQAMAWASQLNNIDGKPQTLNELAYVCYEYADAMIKARET